MNPRNIRLISISIVAVAMFAGQLLAGTNRWTSRGPQGGTISTMVADRANPTILYVGSYFGGVHKSEDAGASWRPVNEGITDLLVTSMVMRRDRAATLFAGTYRGLVFRTRDGGEQWTEIARLSRPIQALAFDHVRGSLYALPEGAFELMRSDDEGDTWRKIDENILLETLTALDGRLYALHSGFLHVSTDGGSVWKPLSVIGFTVASVAVDEERSSIVVGGEGFVARSGDAGKNWERLPFLQQISGVSPVRVNALSPYAGGVVVATNAGVFRYTNGATEWTAVGNALAGSSVSLIVCTTSNSERIFANDAASLYDWTAEQEEWKAVNTGLLSASTLDVAVAGSTVYAATQQGLSSLTEGSVGWNAIDVSSIGTLPIYDVDATTAGVVLAGTGSALHKSDDSGATWKRVSGQQVTAIGLAPSDPKTMYAALADGMAKSTDGGDTWFTIQNNIPQSYYSYYGFAASAIAVDRTNADIVYVCTDGVYKSIDGGKQWKSIFSSWISAFAIDQFNPSLLYGANFDGKVFSSNDAGTSWQPIDVNGKVVALAVDPARASVVYAATAAGNVYRSSNAGKLWMSINAGLPGVQIRTLAIDASGNHLYAATAGGVFEYERDTTYLAGAATRSVSLRTHYANFVSAVDCGDGRASANAKSAGPCETFTLYDVNGGTLADGDRIYLQAANGSFLAAENGGSSACRGCESAVNANRPNAGPWETFTIHKMAGIGSAIADGDRISLQSYAGDFIAAEGGGSNGCVCDSVLHANRSVAQSWETFTILMH
jgi:photosystem II stability/assembly factor-like uncharacterized protein